MPVIKTNLPINPTSRRDQVVIHRCLIGHTRLTHVYLLMDEPAPICERCQCPQTVKHILLDCNNLQRGRPYQANTLKHLFTSIPLNTILQFLHDNDFYYELWDDSSFQRYPYTLAQSITNLFCSIPPLYSPPRC